MALIREYLFSIDLFILLELMGCSFLRSDIFSNLFNVGLIFFSFIRTHGTSKITRSRELVPWDHLPEVIIGAQYMAKCGLDV